MSLRGICLAAAVLGGLLMSVQAAAVAMPGQAADGSAANGSMPWSLDRLLDELRRVNPQLEQARQTWLAARQQTEQAEALPSAQVSLLEQANTGGTFDFNRNSGFYAYYGLTQPLLWPGKRPLNAAIAAEQAAAVGTQYDALLLQLTAALKLGYLQLQILHRQQRFLAEDRQRLQQMKEVAQIRYANNAAAYVDFLNAQVALSSLENDSFALDRQIQSLVEQINTLISRPPQAPLEIEEQVIHPHLPQKPLPELIEFAQANNPTLAGDRHQLAAADKNLALADKAFMPDLQLSVGAYSDPALIHPETTRLYSIGLGLNLPSWGFQKERAGLREATAQRDAARASQQADRQQVELNVANAYHALETALQQSEFTRQRLLPQAQMAWHLALTGYSSGGGTGFSDLLAAQSALRASETQLTQTDVMAEQAYINLVAAIGGDPE